MKCIRPYRGICPLDIFRRSTKVLSSAPLLRTVSLCTCLSIASYAFAGPNGYTQIPIAKVFGNGVAAFSFAESRLGGAPTTFLTTQYGLLNRYELGIDYQSLPGGQEAFLGNAKYLIVHSPGHKPDIACGLLNIAAGQPVQPYIVATRQPSALGVSLGAVRLAPGRCVGMGGFAYSISSRTQLVTDFIGGSENYVTFGVITNLSLTTTLNLAYAAPNTAGGRRGIANTTNAQGFVFNLAYTFHVLHGPESKSGNDSPNKKPTAGTGSGE